MTATGRGGTGRRAWRQRAAMLLGGLTLAGCSTLPSSGPTAAQVRRSAEPGNALGYRIVDIDPAVTEVLGRPDSTDAPLASLSRPGRIDTLGPGDVLDVSIFEVGVTLFSAGSTFSPSARGTPLGGVVVDAAGNIQLPYVGRINVTGKSPADVERQIESAMVGLSQRPQALVTVRQNAYNVFYVSGDVRQPGRLALGLPQERLLDALARAGGTINQPDDMVVRLTRGDTSAETRLSQVSASGPQNIALLPGDRVELFNRPRTYLVFGSTDRVSQIPFGASQLSLAEAMARVGGPSERTADPAAVYLFRYGPPADGGDVAVPVIYRLNMVRADSYFLSQRIVMRDKDVIVIASAAANAPGKLSQILGQLFSPLLAIQSVTR